jgi:hypothetical protein
MTGADDTRDTPILRRPDGSIDTAAYIARARALRSEETHRLLTRSAPRPQPFSRRTLPAR